MRDLIDFLWAVASNWVVLMGNPVSLDCAIFEKLRRRKSTTAHFGETR